jgi:hypothetical protein
VILFVKPVWNPGDAIPDQVQRAFTIDFMIANAARNTLRFPWMLVVH